MSNRHTVIVILDAKKEKIAELESALKIILKASRAEKTNFEYRLHINTDNPQQFILYEQWESKEKHAEQFKKPYIIEFSKQLDDLLDKPYQVYFPKEILENHL